MGIPKERRYKFTISKAVNYKNGDSGCCPIGSLIVKAESATKALSKAWEEAEKIFIGIDIHLTSPKICDEDF